MSGRRCRRYSFLLLLGSTAVAVILAVVGSRPFRRVGHTFASLGRPVANAWHSSSRANSLRTENDRLRQQIAQRRGEQLQAQYDAYLDAQLTALTHIPFLGDAPTQIAAVSSSAEAHGDQLTANQGSGRGIKPGMVAVTRTGLVGLVTGVTAHTSTIKPLTDPSASIDITLDPTLRDPNLVALVAGTGPNSALQSTSGVGPQIGIDVGAAVSTAGITSSIYPGGIPVGRVATTTISPDGTRRLLTVQPAVDPYTVDYLAIVLR